MRCINISPKPTFPDLEAKLSLVATKKYCQFVFGNPHWVFCGLERVWRKAAATLVGKMVVARDKEASWTVPFSGLPSTSSG